MFQRFVDEAEALLGRMIDAMVGTEPPAKESKDAQADQEEQVSG
jgi:hypothetical protein